MTVKLTVSLPDELGDFVKAQGNASRYVADAVRIRQRIDATAAALAAVNVHEVPAEEYARIAASHADLRKRWADPARREYLDGRLRELTRRRPGR
ncbi:hypothetical protein [Allorhizocola rhizosphaerae]|uniref:hypothetical protein n=1 Tax=Allorhizocola rhizosphaerae TaxID=1872709 RepID=UPI000E3D6D33|nr:hypothetical protein [Allorhizocola rhizosphaerae]